MDNAREGKKRKRGRREANSARRRASDSAREASGANRDENTFGGAHEVGGLAVKVPAQRAADLAQQPRALGNQRDLEQLLLLPEMRHDMSTRMSRDQAGDESKQCEYPVRRCRHPRRRAGRRSSDNPR